MKWHIHVFTHTHKHTHTQAHPDAHTHSQTSKWRHYKEITHSAVTVSDLSLSIQSEVRPDCKAQPDPLRVIYVAPVSRVYLRVRRGMKVLTAGVGEGGCWRRVMSFLSWAPSFGFLTLFHRGGRAEWSSKRWWAGGGGAKKMGAERGVGGARRLELHSWTTDPDHPSVQGCDKAGARVCDRRGQEWWEMEVGGKGLRALMGFGTWEGLVTEEDKERLVYCKRMQQTNRRRFLVKTEHWCRCCALQSFGSVQV